MRRSAPQARALLLAVVAILACGAARAYTNLTSAEARDRILAGGDLVLLDVREYTEFCSALEHLENAACLPWSAGVLRADFGKLPPDWDVIVYCAAGSRSANAAAYLEAQGFTSVFNMTGGIFSWPYEKEACDPEPLLFVWRAGDGVRLDWVPAPGTQYYDLLRGQVERITEGVSTVDLGAADCLARETPFTYRADDALPGGVRLWFWVVRQAGSGFGASTGGLPRVSPDCD